MWTGTVLLSAVAMLPSGSADLSALLTRGSAFIAPTSAPGGIRHACLGVNQKIPVCKRPLEISAVACRSSRLPPLSMMAETDVVDPAWVSGTIA